MVPAVRPDEIRNRATEVVARNFVHRQQRFDRKTESLQ
jgi:hypothetical protein